MSSLLVSDLFPPKVGGTTRFYWELYRRLPADDIAIAAGHDPRERDFDQSHTLRLFRVPLTLTSWGIRTLPELTAYAKAIRSLVRIVRQERVRLLQCGRCLPEGVMAWAVQQLTGVPYACYVWGEDITCARESREHTWLTARVLKRARYLVTCSDATRRLLVEDWGVPAGKVHLLYPGVDTAQFTPAPRDPAVRARLGWHDRPVLLTVARLQKRKGHDHMIQALPMIRQLVPDVLYAIVGGGEEEPFLRELVRRDGLEDHVQFLGEMGLHSPDLLHCYQQCDLFVLPNRNVGQDTEGFGMVMIEAQACGKPVIGGNCGGTPETLNVPETGYIVACEDPAEIARVVGPLLADRDRLSRMGVKAREWVVERFDWSAIAREASLIFGAGR